VKVRVVGAPAGQAVDEPRVVVVGEDHRWRRDARQLLRRLARTSGIRPTWLSSSGPVGDPPDDPAKLVSRRVRATAEPMGAREHVVFGGRLPLEPSNFVERAMVRNTPAEKRDARDWQAIQAWAHDIADSLVGAQIPRAAATR
jgi:menaquinone-dependent protoporphyrinogen oxidase